MVHSQRNREREIESEKVGDRGRERINWAKTKNQKGEKQNKSYCNGTNLLSNSYLCV